MPGGGGTIRVNEPATYLGKDGTEWAQTLQHSDPILRRLAVYALGEIGPQASGGGRGPAVLERHLTGSKG